MPTGARAELEALAPTDLPLVLLGETGVGKSLLAREIHRMSRRAGRSAEHVIGSAPDELIFDALLGHVRGAFTGALGARVGLLERAADGTLFLDELGAASRGVQRLLLGLMEGQPFSPLGAERDIRVSIRFIFATNVEPEQLVVDGLWQRDFYYRLGGNFFRLPRLADRPLEIMPLAYRFLGQKLQQLGRRWEPEISSAVEEILLAHPWPGNIRELKSVCERAAALIQTDRPFLISDLTAEFLRERSASRASALDLAAARCHEALRTSRGNQSAAARSLGMQRTTFRRIVARHPMHDMPRGQSRDS